jgi:uridine kinase
MQDTVRATMDGIHGVSNGTMEALDTTIATRAHYSPPWADVSIIGIAGSSGSGKSTLSQAIVRKLNLPWVVIMSMVRKWMLGVAPQKSAHALRIGLLLQETQPGATQESLRE